MMSGTHFDRQIVKKKQKNNFVTYSNLAIYNLIAF